MRKYLASEVMPARGHADEVQDLVGVSSDDSPQPKSFLKRGKNFSILGIQNKVVEESETILLSYVRQPNSVHVMNFSCLG